MVSQNVRMYNPTHRFDTSAETPPTNDPTIAWFYEFQGSIYQVATCGDTVYLAVGKSLVAIDRNGNSRWRFNANAKVYSSPAVVDGIVFIGSHDENIYALDAATGDKQWAFKTSNSVRSSPAVVDGTVLVGSNDQNVYALDAATGDKQWAFKTSNSVKSSPAVVDGTVFFGSFDNHVYTLDAATGDKQWAFETDRHVWSSPAVVDNTVFVGNGYSGGDGHVYALEGTGTEVNGGTE